ncbi:hypothetical protein FHEFKHOI_01976 [Candidatus Methanoperedenaceae archaeon GB50]|nr:MAG: hypothetical protein KBONHNOK_00040 [Candidatus Methanoperedenaceae archaeon GB50]CAD7776653.1 hypothetical protein FHEFKHOI_01976 [Candidatus Methanoperedenaceae archaeon GB50]
MKAILKERDDWRTKEVKELTKKRFGVEYSLRDDRVLITVLIKSCSEASNILKSSGMKYTEPHERETREGLKMQKLHHRTS